MTRLMKWNMRGLPLSPGERALILSDPSNKCLGCGRPVIRLGFTRLNDTDNFDGVYHRKCAPTDAEIVNRLR